MIRKITIEHLRKKLRALINGKKIVCSFDCEESPVQYMSDFDRHVCCLQCKYSPLHGGQCKHFCVVLHIMLHDTKGIPMSGIRSVLNVCHVRDKINDSALIAYFI